MACGRRSRRHRAPAPASHPNTVSQLGRTGRSTIYSKSAILAMTQQASSTPVAGTGGLGGALKTSSSARPISRASSPPSVNAKRAFRSAQAMRYGDSGQSSRGALMRAVPLHAASTKVE